MPASEKDFKKWREDSGTKILVETGTYLGGGIRHALRAGFEKVFSIEASPYYYNLLPESLRQTTGVSIIFGDSVRMLGGALKMIEEPVVFWLDAHSSGGQTFEGDPLLEEIGIIKQWSHGARSFIVADDYNFGSTREKAISDLLAETHSPVRLVTTVPTDEGYGALGGTQWNSVVGWKPNANTA